MDMRETPLIRRICHDLTQPLTALQGCIELALHIDQNAQEMRQSLMEAGEEAARLAELIRAIRSFADAAAPFTQTAPLVLQQAVADAVAQMQHLRGEAAPAFFVEMDELPFAITADANRLAAALQQIMDFSLARASAPVTISLQTSHVSGRVSIVSRGSSLSASDCEALFDADLGRQAGKHIGAADRFRLAAAALTMNYAGALVKARPGTAAEQLIVELIFGERPEEQRRVEAGTRSPD